MTDHETTLRDVTDGRTCKVKDIKAACLAGADALRLLPLAMAGDLCRGGDCQHPDCVNVRALLARCTETE